MMRSASLNNKADLGFEEGSRSLSVDDFKQLAVASRG